MGRALELAPTPSGQIHFTQQCKTRPLVPDLSRQSLFPAIICGPANPSESNSDMHPRSSFLLLSLLFMLSSTAGAENWLPEFTSDALAGSVNAAVRTGDMVYAGGSIGSVSTEVVPSIIRYDLQTGERFIEPAELNSAINDLVFFDRGSGAVLHAATFDGVWALEQGQWQKVGALEDNGTANVFDLEVYDFGDGPQLVATGQFSILPLPDPPIQGLARLVGEQWQPVDGGAEASNGVAMTVWNDQGTDRLAVIGSLSLNGEFNRMLIWNGAGWDAPIDSMGGLIVQLDALTPFPNGSGEDLLICGNFDSVNSVPILGLARWDGLTWSAIPGVENPLNRSCFSMAVLDDTSPPTLLYSGFFWDGSTVDTVFDLQYPARPRWHTDSGGTVFGLGQIGSGETIAVRKDGAWEYPQSVNDPLAGWKIGGVESAAPIAGALLLLGSFADLTNDTTFDLVSWDGSAITGLRSLEEETGFAPLELTVAGSDIHLLMRGDLPFQRRIATISDGNITVSDPLAETPNSISARLNNGASEVFVGTNDGVRRWVAPDLVAVGTGGPPTAFDVVAIDPAQTNGGVHASFGTNVHLFDGAAWSSEPIDSGVSIRFLQKVTVAGVEQVFAQTAPGGLVNAPGPNFVFSEGSWQALGVSAGASSATATRVGDQTCYFVGTAPFVERNCGAGFMPLPEPLSVFGTLTPNTPVSSGNLTRYPIELLSLTPNNERIFVGAQLIRAGNFATAGAGTFDPKVITVTSFE